MPPLAVVLWLTGIAVWANALYFLGVGANTQEGGKDPLKAVGWITLIAGLSNFVQIAFSFTGLGIGVDLAEASTTINLLGGLIVFYAAFFTFLGIVEIGGYDLRVLGNVSIAVALLPFLYWLRFFDGAWMFRTILVIWGIAFLMIAGTTYGKVSAKATGWILVLVATYTFWVPAGYLALNLNIP